MIMASKSVELDVSLLVCTGLILLVILLVSLRFNHFSIDKTHLILGIAGLVLLCVGLILKRKYKVSFPVKIWD